MSPTAINRPSAPWVLAGQTPTEGPTSCSGFSCAVPSDLHSFSVAPFYLRPSQPTKAGMAIITMAGIIVTTTAIAGGITVGVIAVGGGKATQVQSAHCE